MRAKCLIGQMNGAQGKWRLWQGSSINNRTRKYKLRICHTSDICRRLYIFDRWPQLRRSMQSSGAKRLSRLSQRQSAFQRLSTPPQSDPPSMSAPNSKPWGLSFAVICCSSILLLTIYLLVTLSKLPSNTGRMHSRSLMAE